MQESIVFLLRVQCRRKESSRSLSHLLMSFLFISWSNSLHYNLPATIKSFSLLHNAPNSLPVDPVKTLVSATKKVLLWNGTGDFCQIVSKTALPTCNSYFDVGSCVIGI